MFCDTCPIIKSCQSPCQDLNQELDEFRDQPFENLKSPAQIERILFNQARFRFFGDREIHQEESPEEEPPTSDYSLLYEAVETLTPRQRECIELRFWRNLSPTQIASVLGVTRQAVVRRLNAAYSSLRDKYQCKEVRSGCAFVYRWEERDFSETAIRNGN